MSINSLQMSIQDRLQIIIKMHSLSPSAFADQIGVQRSNVSHVLSGRNKPSLDFLEKIIVSFPRVNAHWLITGEMSDVSTGAAGVHEERHAAYGAGTASQKEKEIDRIVVFYTDKTFDTYRSSEG